MKEKERKRRSDNISVEMIAPRDQLRVPLRDRPEQNQESRGNPRTELHPGLGALEQTFVGGSAKSRWVSRTGVFWRWRQQSILCSFFDFVAGAGAWRASLIFLLTLFWRCICV